MAEYRQLVRTQVRPIARTDFRVLHDFCPPLPQKLREDIIPSHHGDTKVIQKTATYYFPCMKRQIALHDKCRAMFVWEEPSELREFLERREKEIMDYYSAMKK